MADTQRIRGGGLLAAPFLHVAKTREKAKRWARGTEAALASRCPWRAPTGPNPAGQETLPTLATGFLFCLGVDGSLHMNELPSPKFSCWLCKALWEGDLAAKILHTVVGRGFCLATHMSTGAPGKSAPRQPLSKTPPPRRRPCGASSSACPGLGGQLPHPGQSPPPLHEG